MKCFKFSKAAVALLIVLLLSGLQTVQAQQLEGKCMQDVAGFSLNCTANDVQIAGVAKNPDGTPMIHILDDGCAFPGDTVTFTATFDVVVSATERYDVGIYFATDGDPDNNGALVGGCMSAILLPASAIDFDGDKCGDIAKARNPLKTVITQITTKCIDPDRDGFLNLPYCTSWRQSGANTVCNSPTDAYPGAPSKCRCDMGFNVPIHVPSAGLKVEKTASPSTRNEPGGPVTFSVSVTNTGIDPVNYVTLNSLTDDIYGSITKVGGMITATTCSDSMILCPNVPNVVCPAGGKTGTYNCTFTANVLGNAGDIITDIVTATGTDFRGNPIKGSDDATVTIKGVMPAIEVTKTANPESVMEPGDNVTFTVVITNKSVSTDPVTINTLQDNIYGNLNGQGTCSVPQTLKSGATYSCSFTKYVSGGAGTSQTDTVTAQGADDEGEIVTGTDDATVKIQNSPSKIDLVKTVDNKLLKEPGGSITYTFTVTNLSAVDTITINSLTDTVLGDLNGQGDCSVPFTLKSGGVFTCQVPVTLEGDAFDSVTNTATASGTDDDGEVVSDFDSVTVNITNVPPDATLTKTPTEVLVTYQVKVCNSSSAEELYLDSLYDDVYHDITKVQGDITETNCGPAVLMPRGQKDDCYTCSFKAKATKSPTIDTVTGVVSDNDGSTPIEISGSATVTFQAN